MKSSSSLIVTAVVAAVLLGVGGFIGGIQYQKSRGSTTASALAANGPGSGFGGRAMNGGLGSVSAVTSSSITVKSERQGTTKTFSISASTVVSDSGTTKAVSDIAVGDTVMVRTSDSTSTAATSILLNPTMGIGGQGQPGAAPTDTSVDGQSI